MGTQTKIPISHGSGQMRAQSFSIQVSNRTRCNAGCLSCIARLTPGAQDQQNAKDIRLCDFNRLRVGLGYAKQLGATHAVLTSRADPSQEEGEYLVNLVSTAREYLPLVDVHTNGFLWLPDKPRHNVLKEMVAAGLTMITFSIASADPTTNQAFMKIRESAARLIATALDLGLLVRCSVMIQGSGVRDFDGIMKYIRAVGNLGAQMVVCRELWIPDVYAPHSKLVYDYNRTNWLDIAPFQARFRHQAEIPGNEFGIKELNPLPWGTPVFVVEGIFDDLGQGVNVTFARCEEANMGTVMKSIVHKPDGHGYRNWDHNGDILY